jgi:hypothetical protein
MRLSTKLPEIMHPDPGPITWKKRPGYISYWRGAPAPPNRCHRVAEVDERVPLAASPFRLNSILVVHDLADLDATLNQVCAGRLNILYDHLQALQ